MINEEKMRLVLDDKGFYYYNLVDILKDENPYFVLVELLRRGMGSMRRKPRPRYFSEQAVKDSVFGAIDAEVLLGHRVDKNNDTSEPLGKSIGARLTEGLRGQALLYIPSMQSELIQKIKTGVISALSIDYSGLVITNYKIKNGIEGYSGYDMSVDFITRITRLDSIDIVNNNQRGIETAGIISSGAGLEFIEGIEKDFRSAY